MQTTGGASDIFCCSTSPSPAERRRFLCCLAKPGEWRMAKGGLQEKEAQALSLCSGVDAAELDLRLPEPRPHGILTAVFQTLSQGSSCHATPGHRSSRHMSDGSGGSTASEACSQHSRGWSCLWHLVQKNLKLHELTWASPAGSRNSILEAGAASECLVVHVCI